MTGSCHCGNVRYRSDAEKKFEFFCHCTSCRKLNGGGHLAGITIDKESLKVEGEAATYVFKGGSGDPITLTFCPRCATQLFAVPEHYPGLAVIRANTLDEGEFSPTKSIYAHEAFGWDHTIPKD